MRDNRQLGARQWPASNGSLGLTGWCYKTKSKHTKKNILKNPKGLDEITIYFGNNQWVRK